MKNPRNIERDFACAQDEDDVLRVTKLKGDSETCIEVCLDRKEPDHCIWLTRADVRKLAATLLQCAVDEEDDDDS